MNITLLKEVTNFLSEIFNPFSLNTKISGIYRQLFYKIWIELMVSNK